MSQERDEILSRYGIMPVSGSPMQLGPHDVIWHPSADCPNVKRWLRKNCIIAYPGWKIYERSDGTFRHGPKGETEEQYLARALEEQQRFLGN